MRSASPEGPPDPIDRAVMEFDELWDAGTPSLEGFWAGLGPDRPLVVLSALIKIDLMRRFERGERPRAAQFLTRFPELAKDSGRAVSLIYEEFCLLEEHGEVPDSAEFCETYEPWRDSLASQLVYHRELSQIAGTPPPAIRFPVPGERFATFRLRSILGKGGAAQVYLATDEKLADRRVAIKISASVGREPSILANLDHRGIVPILTVAESAETGLRGICMPYRPGETLEGLIRKVARGTPPRRAMAVWDALKPTGDAIDDDLDAERAGWVGFPIHGTYHEAVAFIGLSLASATGYLHTRGVLHRDIKPANILLAYREGPQLLDFNLAHTPNQPEHAQAALKGGTLPYMAPEQLSAFLDPALWASVGSSADIYALGLVLKELSTGHAPDAPDGRLPLQRAIKSLHDRRSCPGIPIRQINPSIPPALESIIGRCTAFDPADRYAKAEDLATDLRRFLERKPLRSASNTSLMERGSNFVYRNWIAAGMLIVLAIMAAFVQREPPAASDAGASIEQTTEFEGAVSDYLSHSKRRWERARLAFEDLERRDYKSAWPKLYLGLALEKLDRNEGADEKLEDSTRLADADRALDRALADEPLLPTLLTLNASRLLARGKIPEARLAITAALQIQPDRLGALGVLASLEQKANRNVEAIDCFHRMIAIGEQRPAGPRMASDLMKCRHLLVVQLAKVADRWVDSGESAERREMARPTLDEIGRVLSRMDADWDLAKGSVEPGLRELTGHYYRGIQSSGLAVLEADRGSIDGAKVLFERAMAEFGESRRAVLLYPKQRIRQVNVEDSIRQLDVRARRFIKDPAWKLALD